MISLMVTGTSMLGRYHFSSLTPLHVTLLHHLISCHSKERAPLDAPLVYPVIISACFTQWNTLQLIIYMNKHHSPAYLKPQLVTCVSLTLKAVLLQLSSTLPLLYCCFSSYPNITIRLNTVTYLFNKQNCALYLKLLSSWEKDKYKLPLGCYSFFFFKFFCYFTEKD